jgi:hypothetical protein
MIELAALKIVELATAGEPNAVRSQCVLAARATASPNAPDAR